LPQLSVVIPVYDNWWLTARCLRALERLRASGTVDFETIVVDNGSSDETPSEIRSFAWIRYLRFEENRNFAGACNAGAAMASAPVTLFLNNDAYPLGDALAPLVRAFERADVAIAGGALFFEDGATQAAGLVLLPDSHWHYYCRNLPPSLLEIERARDALAVSGAAMAVRTGWYLDDGGFDEAYRNGFEDVDLCMRARAQGRAVRYVPSARFAHYEAASAGRFEREEQNEKLFYSRWLARMEPLPRTQRGAVGAIAFETARGEPPLLAAARHDLQQALRSFGHPVARGRIPAWRRLDRRYRRSASLAWFGGAVRTPGIAIDECAGGAAIRTHGAVALEVPWLACASLERVKRLGVRARFERDCVRFGVAGGTLDGAVTITPEMLLGSQRCEVAFVVHLGRTDPAAFGNVLLAQAGVPAIVLATPELTSLFADDVAVCCERDSIAQHVASLLADRDALARYGRLLAADARRRFSPRRSAIRVVDLLCGSRFGLERPFAGSGITQRHRDS